MLHAIMYSMKNGYSFEYFLDITFNCIMKLFVLLKIHKNRGN